MFIPDHVMLNGACLCSRLQLSVVKGCRGAYQVVMQTCRMQSQLIWESRTLLWWYQAHLRCRLVDTHIHLQGTDPGA